MEPFVKLFRKFLDWEWYSDINTSRLFLHLLLSANWKDGSFKGMTIKRGQLVSSTSNLSEKTSLTVNEVRTALKHLKSTGEITSKSYTKFTVFTVVGYDLYQAVNKQNDTENTNEITSQETSKITNEAQTINELLTTIEDLKNSKNDKKKDIVADTLAYQEDSFEIRCVNALVQSCLRQFQGSKVPQTLEEKQSWCDHVEKMKRLDKRSEVDILEALDFAVTDNFWQSNIRSTKKFREKFEILITQARKKPAPTTTKKNAFHNFEQRDTDYDAAVQASVAEWLQEDK